MEKLLKHYWLYVLLLKEGKYYVGITSHKDPHTRIKQHINGTILTSKWVEKYPYEKTLELVDLGGMSLDEAEKIEDEYTLRYMGAFGYNNVRGGSFTYRGQYKKLGNRYLTKENYEILSVVVFLTLIILFLGLRIYVRL